MYSEKVTDAKRNRETSLSERIRHCVECPKCLTRHLIGFSPYGNRPYLVSEGCSFPESEKYTFVLFLQLAIRCTRLNWFG